MKRFDILNPDNEAVGNVYEYRKGYYHNSRNGMHGPFETSQAALAEWCGFWRKDPAYFDITENGQPSVNARQKLQNQFALHSAAAALGRKGGLAKSERKTAAVRENAKKGGRPRKTKEEGKEMMYFLRGTVANGEIIFQNGWEWANDLTLNGPASNENEVGSCVPNANGYWEHRGFRQIIAKEAESILADAGYLEMPEEWFPQERKD